MIEYNLKMRDEPIAIESKITPTITDHNVEEMTIKINRIKDQLSQLVSFFHGDPIDEAIDKDTCQDITNAFDALDMGIPFNVALQQKLGLIDQKLEAILVLLCFCNDAK